MADDDGDELQIPRWLEVLDWVRIVIQAICMGASWSLLAHGIYLWLVDG